MKTFYNVLANTVLASVTNMTVWFAITFFTYLQTQAVFATSLLSGLYLVVVAVTGIWFGSLVDHFPKKRIMLISSVLSFAIYAAGFGLYQAAPEGAFSSISSVWLWSFAPLLLAGVIIGNLRAIALPTVITMLIPEKDRDRANGLAGTANGISFLVTSVISGLLVGHSGMYWVLILAMVMMVVTFVHLWLTPLAEKKGAVTDDSAKPATSKLDLKGTIAVIATIPGLFALIFFSMFNNFLGGVFMALMDAYGLSLVSVQVWGLLWGFLSTAFIIGGGLIAKFGLGKNPLKSLFMANLFIWSICSVFTIYPSIILLVVGMFMYMCVVPYIQAAEFTIIQKVVPADRQGRVFGFAQSVEQSASPLTAFAIGPITQFFFIPFMTTGAGVGLIGTWFGTGADRGIALVFTLAGMIGLVTTLLAFRSRYYHLLSQYYLEGHETRTSG